MAGYNWVDYALLAVFFLTAMSGIVRGGAKEIISILSWVAAYFVAAMFSESLATYFSSNTHVQAAFSSGVASQISSFTLIASFCLLFFGTLIIGSIIGSIVGHAVDSIGLGIVNRLLGGVVGLAKGYLVNVVIIFLVQAGSFEPQPAWSQSVMVNTMQPAVVWFSNLVAPGIAAIKTKMQNFNSGLQNTASGMLQQH